MKRFKVNKGLYSILPVITLLVILVYIFVLYKKSYTSMNIANIVIDILILLLYLTKFCYEVSMDGEGINFYTIFKKYRISRQDVLEIRQSSFLTKIEAKKKTFYILTTFNGRYILYRMFMDIKQ